MKKIDNPDSLYILDNYHLLNEIYLEENFIKDFANKIKEWGKNKFILYSISIKNKINKIKNDSEEKIIKLVGKEKAEEIFNKVNKIIEETKPLLSNKKDLIDKKTLEIKDKSYIIKIKKYVNEIKKISKEEAEKIVEEDENKKSKIEKIIISLTFVFLIARLNKIALLTFSLIFGNPVVGLILAATTLGPFIEEFFRYISLKNDMKCEFFITFNIFEFTLYLINLTIMGTPLIVSIISRTIAVLAHFSFMKIQEKLGKKISPEAGLIGATAAHMLYNTMATLIPLLFSFSQ